MSFATICSNAILIWYTGLLPSLLPFMILSNLVVRMHLETWLIKIAEIILRPLFRLSSQANYVIGAGFLFGFPMGAKVIGQLYEDKRLSYHESMYLLAFCNHLSPIYIITYVIPLLKISGIQAIKYVCLFYGVPLFYGIVLRYTYYKKRILFHTKLIGIKNVQNKNDRYSFCYSLDVAITDALISIAKMGGYMVALSAASYIYKQIITAFPVRFCDVEMLYSTTFALFEISAGLAALPLSNVNIFLSLLYITIGGLSCVFQTRSVLKNTDISLKPYIIHKLINCIIISVLYFFIR